MKSGGGGEMLEPRLLPQGTTTPHGNSPGRPMGRRFFVAPAAQSLSFGTIARPIREDTVVPGPRLSSSPWFQSGLSLVVRRAFRVKSHCGSIAALGGVAMSLAEHVPSQRGRTPTLYEAVRQTDLGAPSRLRAGRTRRNRRLRPKSGRRWRQAPDAFVRSNDCGQNGATSRSPGGSSATNHRPVRPSRAGIS